MVASRDCYNRTDNVVSFSVSRCCPIVSHLWLLLRILLERVETHPQQPNRVLELHVCRLLLCERSFRGVSLRGDALELLLQLLKLLIQLGPLFLERLDLLLELQELVAPHGLGDGVLRLRADVRQVGNLRVGLKYSSEMKV